jgi:hypothetical protein
MSVLFRTSLTSKSESANNLISQGSHSRARMLTCARTLSHTQSLSLAHVRAHILSHTHLRSLSLAVRRLVPSLPLSGSQPFQTISFHRERVLFIGTQFSILYTSMYSPAEAATFSLSLSLSRQGSRSRSRSLALSSHSLSLSLLLSLSLSLSLARSRSLSRSRSRSRSLSLSRARALSRSLMCARTHSLAHTFTVSLSLSQCVVCKKVGRSGAMLTALWLSTISNNLISIIEQFQTI